MTTRQETGQKAEPNDGWVQATLKSLEALVKFSLYCLISILIPERFWFRFSSGLASITSRLKLESRNLETETITSVLGFTMSEGENRKLHREASTHAFMNALVTMGQLFSKGRSPDVIVRGLEHIAAAQEQGNGTVLWLCPFCYTRMVAKLALHQKGIQVSHLSRDTHGFGGSPAAVRLLNRHWVRAENMYLKERLVMTADNEAGALRRLLKCLRENGVVSVALNEQGKKCMTVPFLNGTLSAAMGPLGLAVSNDTVVLPVYTLGNDQGGYEVIVDRPLEASHNDDRDIQIETMFKELAGRLEPLAAEHPEQWYNWGIVGTVD